MTCSDLLARIADGASRSWPDAVSLPPAAYFSEDLLELEIERVFKREWLCVGHVSQLVGEGSYLTADIAGTPIAILRTWDDTLSVVANSCAHRGAKLLIAQGRAKLLVCRYHGWSYDLGGLLVRAPGMPEGDVRLIDCRLPRVRHEVWNGWIYITLNPNPHPFFAPLAGLSELVSPCRVADMSVLFALEEEWPANWKMLAENFMESYHVPIVHPQTVNRGTPIAGVRCWPGGDGFTYHTLNIKPQDNNAAQFADRVPSQIRGKEILACIFPSHLLSITPCTALSLSVQPLGVERLRASVVYVVSPELLRVSGQTADAAAQNARAYFDTFNAEDKAIIARLCAGLKSSLAHSGPLAPLERPLWEFHRYLASRLCSA